MELKVFRKGFNYSQDGPGNRLVYHLQGCNMRCTWCSNPEGVAMDGVLMVKHEALIDGVCPHGAIADKRLDREICLRCVALECTTLNRNQGIQFSAQACDVEAIVDEAKRSIPLFYDGGGVTLSGGEATVQFEALQLLLQRLKDEGIHTAIETNGSHPRLRELFPLIDYLIIDFKHHDDFRLKDATGVGNLVIKRNVAKALAVHQRLLIRIPLIARFNDSDVDAEHFAAFFRQFDTGNARFEFITYHEYGKDKWAQCGMPYRVEDGFVGEETLAQFQAVFQSCQLDVIHT